MDELRYNDPDCSPESFDKADYGSIEETHAEQPTTQSGSQCSQAEDYIPIYRREWIDITANECSHKCHLEARLSEFVMRFVRHMDFQEKESDGVVHWKSISSQLRYAFLKDGGDTFSDDEWNDHIGREAVKRDFSTARTPATVCCIFVLFKDTGGEVNAP